MGFCRVDKDPKAFIKKKKNHFLLSLDKGSKLAIHFSVENVSRSTGH